MAQGFTTPNHSIANNSNYNLHQAIQYAGLAVEADPEDVKHWHLLGLLLGAQERWEEAREILERGADLSIGDDDVAGSEVGGGLPRVEMGDGDENDTLATVQADARTLLGPPISIRNTATDGDSNSTPAIKISEIGNLTINCPSPITSTNSTQPIYVLSQLSPSTTPGLLPASTLLLTPPPCRYPPSPYDLFESHLQLRMTQGTVTEIVEGAEGAEALWLEVFGWVAEKRSAATATAAGDGVQRLSMDGITRPSSDHIGSQHDTTMTSIHNSPRHLHPNPNIHHHQHQQPSYLGAPTEMYQIDPSDNGSSDLDTNGSILDTIPIKISPATPVVGEKAVEESAFGADVLGKGKDRDREKDQGKEKRTINSAFRPRRSTSIDIDNNRLDVQKSKKNVGQMLKGSVKKSRAGITAATRKFGHGVVRHGGLRRSTSTPGSFWFLLIFLFDS